jgi:hypothetical protein
MDAVRMEDLREMCTNSMDDVRVKRITMNLVGLRAAE